VLERVLEDGPRQPVDLDDQQASLRFDRRGPAANAPDRAVGRALRTHAIRRH
jgi:hypothetical protein